MRAFTKKAATVLMVLALLVSSQSALAWAPQGSGQAPPVEDLQIIPEDDPATAGIVAKDTALASSAPLYVPETASPGFYAARDNRNLDATQYNLVGGHQSVYWDDLEPSEGNYDWSSIEDFVAEMAASGKKAAIGIITYAARANLGNATDPPLRTPAWVFTAGAGKIYCPGGLEIPRYWDAVYQAKYSNFVQALAAEYDGDSRIEYFQIGVGKYGESQPCDDVDDAYVKAALEADGHTVYTWPYIVNDIVDIYANAFDQTPVVLPNSPRFSQECDRQIFTDHAIEQGVGLFPAGLEADLEWVDLRTYRSGGWNGCGKYDRLLDQAESGNTMPWVPISFEMYEYMTPDTTSFYWGVLAALSRRADYITAERDVLYEGEANDPVVTPITDNIEIMGWANQYLGQLINTTPSVWVVLRDTGYASHYYAQKGNYNFWLTQDDTVSQGKTVPVTYRPQSELIKSAYWATDGVAAVNTDIETSASLGWYKEGWIARRTDQSSGNPYMWFQIDDGYLNGGPVEATITVTYFDTGTDTWKLEYDSTSNAYKTAGSVTKTNTRTWKDAVFTVTDARFSNSQLGGSDFRINCNSDGNEYIHMVDVRSGDNPNVTQNISLTSAGDGWNLVSFRLIPSSTAIADVLSSISGKYDLVQAYSNGSWHSYSPSGGGDLAALTNAMGFWIHMTQSATLTVTGQAPTSTQISLSSSNGGWNLIGWPSASSPTVANALSGISGSYSLVHAYSASDTDDPWKIYNPGAPSYASDLTNMVSGQGYWIRVSGNVSLTVTG